jgi:hypothetical protein
MGWCILNPTLAGQGGSLPFGSRPNKRGRTEVAANGCSICKYALRMNVECTSAGLNILVIYRSGSGSFPAAMAGAVAGHAELEGRGSIEPTCVPILTPF